MSGTQRNDLLALTVDDLATLTNRGTVKRAQKELDSQELTCRIEEHDTGDLLFHWSNGITCRFPAGKSVHDAICSSGLAGISRHILRSVLVYQREHLNAGGPGNATVGAPAIPSESGLAAEANEIASEPKPSAAVVTEAVVPTAGNHSWDPGAISDDKLIGRFRKPAILQARKRFAQGVLVELTRGSKPIARFLDEGCTVRFMVPHDLRYVTADCAEAMLSTWAPLAVWAFRELPADRPAGLLCLQQAELPAPKQSLDELDALLTELCREGMSGVSDVWPQKFSRVEESLRSDGLIWPAELVVDLLQQHEMYRKFDALFDPQEVVHLVGELLVRTRAIRNGTKAVPQPLIRGTRSDRSSEIAGGRLIGVGLGVRKRKKHATLSAYLQDVDSGSVVAVERTYADPAPESGEPPRSFTDLANRILVRGISLAGLSASQLLLKSGKRTPGGQLILPRTASSLTTHPQSYQWEQLKPPFAVEDFAQLTARLETLPPSALRPRRSTETLHVVAVAGAFDPFFDTSRQKLTATLQDARGDAAQLVHAWHFRSRQGFNELSKSLEQKGDQVRFVCGHVRSTNRGLEIHPVGLVLDDGGRRTLVQPWITPTSRTLAEALDEFDSSESPNDDFHSPIEDLLQRITDELSELLLTGLSHSRPARWTELAGVAAHLGFARLPGPLKSLAEALLVRQNALRSDPAHALRHVRELCLLLRLAAE